MVLVLVWGMDWQGLAPNVISCAAAISAYKKGQQKNIALVLVWEMDWQGLAPNVISYIAAISGCEKGQKWPMVLELVQEVHWQRLVPNVHQPHCSHQRMWGGPPVGDGSAIAV